MARRDTFPPEGRPGIGEGSYGSLPEPRSERLSVPHVAYVNTVQLHERRSHAHSGSRIHVPCPDAKANKVPRGDAGHGDVAGFRSGRHAAVVGDEDRGPFEEAILDDGESLGLAQVLLRPVPWLQEVFPVNPSLDVLNSIRKQRLAEYRVGSRQCGQIEVGRLVITLRCDRCGPRPPFSHDLPEEVHRVAVREVY